MKNSKNSTTEVQIIQSKMGKWPEQTPHERRNTNSQSLYGKMFSVFNKWNCKTALNSTLPNKNGYHQACKKTIEADKGGASLVHCWWKCKLVHALWKSVWRFFKTKKNNRTTRWARLTQRNSSQHASEILAYPVYWGTITIAKAEISLAACQGMNGCRCDAHTTEYSVIKKN